jgi:hypothetical protein
MLVPDNGFVFVLLCLCCTAISYHSDKICLLTSPVAGMSCQGSLPALPRCLRWEAYNSGFGGVGCDWEWVTPVGQWAG